MDEELHLLELRRAHRRRLNILEEQIALYGVVDAPAHLQIQAEGVRKEIEVIEAKLKLPAVGDEVASILSPADLFLAIGQRIQYAADRLEAQIAAVREESRNRHATERDAREKGQRTTRWLLLGIAAALITLAIGFGVLAGVLLAGR